MDPRHGSILPLLDLIAPTLDLREDFVAMAREYMRLGNDREQALFRQAMADVPAYLRLLEERAAGRMLLDGQVPYHTYWLVRDGRTIVASSTLRHYLTPALRIEGGHIGYGTRPGERRKGYGRLICERTLQKARQRGLSRVLLTCNTENTASMRIIQSCGGQLEGESLSPRTGKPVSRFWIDL